MNTNVSFVERMRWRLKAFEFKYSQYRSSTNDFIEAITQYGKIRGAKRMSLYEQPYICFEGIPYAQPPLGELRFRAPRAPAPWDGVKDCTNRKDKPVQVNFISNKVEGSEDCLYLNVYTNSLDDRPRPVLVWIHGGGFIMGEASREFYGPDYFIHKDVVLVTIQYRLGVLGFLSLNMARLHVPGNAGLKDQVMALKWVKQNIAHFGGNPECITVLGESAGGASTHYMAMTEQTKGLFHRSILMSGNAFAPWACTRNRDRPYVMAQLLGFRSEDDNEPDVLEFLMAAKAKDMIRVEERVLTPLERKKRILFPFGPTVEPFETPECVIPKDPREMMKTAWGNLIPTLTGNTSMEGLIFLPETKLFPSVIKDLDACVNFVPHDLQINEINEDKVVAYGQILKNTHIPEGQKPSAEIYFDVCSIMHAWFPMHRMLKSRLAYSGEKAPIYIYRFDFDSEELINPYRIMRWGRGVTGVSHADELSYLFTSMLSRRLPKDSREYRTITRMIGIWTKFAIDGNPFDKDLKGMKDLHWLPVKKADQVYKCLNISDELKVIELPEMSKIKSWESLYEYHRDKFF